MIVQTFSIAVGTEACNAKCPYCVASMTPAVQDNKEALIVHTRNFNKAANLAKMAGATTAMLTGKGEPTLYPTQIKEYLLLLQKWDFPLIELQTNGLLLASKISDAELAEWYRLGLNTIAISVSSFDPEENRRNFTPKAKEYMDLPALISRLKKLGFVIRLNCILQKLGTHTPEHVEKLILTAKSVGVDQLTLTPVNKPVTAVAKADSVVSWITSNGLSRHELVVIQSWLDTVGTKVFALAHGAVYDVAGQNVCYAPCLTLDVDQDSARNLIFYSNGTLVRSWEHPSTIILR